MAEEPYDPQQPAPPAVAPCPVCGQAVKAEDANYPFCCRRCRLIDLGKWIKGDYRISRPLEQDQEES